MAEQDGQRKRHFILKGTAETEPFHSPQQGGGGASVPDRNRSQHSAALMRQLEALRPHLLNAREAQKAGGMEEGFGLQVEFESFPDIGLAFESLAREQSGIELLNVHHDEQQTLATVFVPDGKLDTFEKLIQAYLDESKDTKNGPKNRKLLNAIAEIRAATLNALWTDDPAVLPAADEETLWWEVWLPLRGDRAATTGRFKQMANGLGFQLAPGELQFPERTVLLAYGSVAQMKQSVLTLNSIAELRLAKETAEFFDALPPAEQPSWLDDLLARLSVPGQDADVPHVCLFDTGVNHGHPLVVAGLAAPDLHTVEPGWGTNDDDGHGTEMAGLALAGNLTEALASQLPLDVAHRLESVKLLPAGGANGGDARHHGISRPRP